MTKFFSKNCHCYLDLEPSYLKVELAQDAEIPNKCVKIYLNPLVNAGSRVMTIFFSLKIATVTLTLSPATCSRYYHTQNPLINVGTRAMIKFF